METRDQEELIVDFVNRRLWAIVGASQDRNKYGNRVFRSLRSAGYRVYPVNPSVEEVEGAAAYASLADLPEPPEVVNLVVPPAVTEKVVREARELGLTRIWMQPGAESEEAIRFCEMHGMQLVVDDCAMVRKREWD
jgi:predicted CoA-binding protein